MLIGIEGSVNFDLLSYKFMGDVDLFFCIYIIDSIIVLSVQGINSRLNKVRFLWDSFGNDLRIY